MSAEEIEQLLNQAIQAAKAGNKADARRLLEQVLERDDANEQAWLVLAGIVDTPRERRICLENVLEINPNNEKAKQALAVLKPSPPSSGANVPTPRPVPTSVPTPTRSSAVRTPPVAAPTKRAGATTPGAQDAWRKQRSQGRLNPRFVLAAALSVALIIVGLFIIAGTDDGAARPTPSAQPLVQAATTRPPEATPTPRGTVVEFVPNPLALQPTWTPSITPTPPPSATPTPTLPAVANYTIAYVGEGRGRAAPGIYVMQGDGSGERLLIQGEESATDPAWSPDGRRIAFVTVVEGKPQLAIAEVDGSSVQVITALGGQRLRAPEWSPDGSQIAFVSDDPGNDEIFLIRPDGSELSRLTSNNVADTDPAWSPDGGKLVYASDPTGRGALQIFVRDLRSSAANPVEQLTNSQGQNYSPAWSPDGASIVFISTRNRFGRVFVMRADGVDERVLTIDDGGAENRDPAWSPDGSYILFASTRNGGIFQLFVMQPNGKGIQQITNQAGPSYGGKFRPGF